MNIKKRQIKAIKELIVPYWKGERERSVKLNKKGFINCMYNHPDGHHCAFAMACKSEERKNLQEHSIAGAILMERGESVLIEKYQNLFNSDQWNAVQRLHDNMINTYKDMILETTDNYLDTYSRELGIDLFKILKEEEFGIDL